MTPVTGFAPSARHKVTLRGVLWINFAAPFREFWTAWHALPYRPAELDGLEDREFAGPLDVARLADCWRWLCGLPGFTDPRMPADLRTAILIRDVVACPWGACGECQHTGWLPRGHHYLEDLWRAP